MKTFNESTTHHDPFKQFEEWFREVFETQVKVPHAMTLTTVNHEHRPSARVVLMQHFDSEGLFFYTNYKSQKARDIEQNPFCCVVFFWPELQRQVRIEGKLNRVSEEISENYFMSRPYESRLGAWASPQSEIIRDRNVLEEKLEQVVKEFEGKEVTKPAWWGGYVLVPDRFEFWQERHSRLHDRICYVKLENGLWSKNRLAP